MKKIEVSDDMYDKLLELAKEYVTQDNRMTAKPYLFQIQTTEEIVAPDTHSDNYIWYNSDGEDLRTQEDINIYLSETLDMTIEKIQELSEEEKEDFLEDRDWDKIYITTQKKYENAFFTAKACKEHIRKNHYHYNEPVDYLNCSWRNPEMDLISNFLIELSNNGKDK